METFTCPRCLRSSAGPDDVREGWCGACGTRTRIDGLTVVMEHHGEYECRDCGAGYVVPPAHYGSVLCTCGSFMRERLRPEVHVRGQLSPQAREQAERYAGSRGTDAPARHAPGAAGGGPGTPERISALRSLPGSMTARDAYRIWRDLVAGERVRVTAAGLLDPDSAAARAVARSPDDGMSLRSPGMVLRLFTGQEDLSREDPGASCADAPGYTSGAIAEAADWGSLLAGLTVTSSGPFNPQHLAGLTVTASGTFSEQELLDFYRQATGMPLDLSPSPPRTPRAGRDLGPIGACSLDPEEFAGPPDRSLLGALDKNQIDEILARNQNVMDDVRGLIMNHSESDSGVPRPVDIETWSPGHP